LKVKRDNNRQWFFETHADFLQILPNLENAIEKAFDRTFTSRGPTDGVVFHLGRLCVDDFYEILILCENGHGLGGMKLLRPFYERVVTMAYISRNPCKTEEFLGYLPIHQGKELNHLKRFLEYAPEQERQVSEIFSEQEIEEIEKKYKEAQVRYQEPLCTKCGTTKTQFQWSTLDIFSMAQKVGLGAFYFTSYYLPLLYGHPSFSSIMKQLAENKDAKPSAMHDPAAQHQAVDLALQGAHNLILLTLATQNELFDLNLDNRCAQDFQTYWSHVPLLIRLT
jgi:hypothetical protein